MTSNHRRKAAVRARQQVTGEPYSVARRRAQTLDDVLREHPELSDFGYGASNSHQKTDVECDRDLQRSRERLRRAEVQVDDVRDWLIDNLAPIKTPTQSSYLLKHVVERVLGGYVSNGRLIAAAILAGYPISRPDSPNVLVAVRQRDLDRVRARQHPGTA